MSRRLFCMLLLLSLIVGTFGFKTTPVAAAVTDSNTAFADYLPADTILYGNIRTADLQKNVGMITTLIGQISGTKPDPYQKIDEGLTKFLGRDASFKKDIMPWLGDNIAVGLILSDADMIGALSSDPRSNLRKVVIIVSVKDQTAGDAFLDEVLKKLQEQNPDNSGKVTQIQIGNDTATIYAGKNGSLVKAKGFYALGEQDAIDQMLSTIKDKQPTLADAPGFSTTMKLLKANNFMNAYVSPRLYKLLMQAVQTYAGMMTLATPAATPNAAQAISAMQDIYGAINGQAFSFRTDNKAFILDVAQNIDLNKIKQAMQNLYGPDFTMPNMVLPPLSDKLAGQIPNNALVAALASGGLSTLYQNLKTSLKNAAKFNATSTDQVDKIEKGFNQFEGLMKLQFNIDPQDDIFSWMTGEFALYFTYNPDSVLNTMAQKSDKSKSAPIDITFLVKSGDVSKTQNFITKFNTGLKTVKDVTLEDAGNGMSTVTGKEGVSVSYGLSGDTFLMTTSSGLKGALAALQGTSPLSGSAAWKNAQANAIKQPSGIVFIDFAQIVPIIKAAIPADQLSTAKVTQGLALLDTLESLSISGSTDDSGTSLGTLQLTLK